MQVTLKINDRGNVRDAIPLRAIPYVTSWKDSPDGIVRTLAAPKTVRVGSLEITSRYNGLFAYQMDAQGHFEKVPPEQWESWVVTLDSLTKKSQADERDGAENENHASWRIKAVLELPDNVFVWLDEFQAWHSLTRPIVSVGPLALSDADEDFDMGGGDIIKENDRLCLVPILPNEIENRVWRYAEGFIATKPDGLQESVVIHRHLAAAVEAPATQTENDTADGKDEGAGKPVRINQIRAFLLDCFKSGADKTIESIWLHIRNNAGKEKFLFKSASNSTATTLDDKKVEKKNLARNLRDLLQIMKTD